MYMKLQQLFEYNPSQENWANAMDAMDVVHSILGDLVWDNDSDEEPKPGFYVVSRSWIGYPIFADMDLPPGEGGAIGLNSLYGTSAFDVTTAAHESFHALLHSQGKNFHDEIAVNNLTRAWIQQNIKDTRFLRACMHILNNSDRSYS